MTRAESRPGSEDAATQLVILKYQAIYALTAPPRDMLSEWFAAWSDSEQAEFAATAEAKRDEFWQPLKEAGLWEAMSPRQREFAQSTIVTMTPRQQIDASWRVEAAAVLAWALCLLDELPPFHVGVDHDLLKRIPADIAAFVKNASLRSDEAIERMRDVAEFWHWRSRTRQLQEQGDEFQPDDEMLALGLRNLDDIVRVSARTAFEHGTLPELVDEDFAVEGKAYRDLDEEEWSNVRSITAERHFALNWLCGYAPGNRWDDTPTDT